MAALGSGYDPEKAQQFSQIQAEAFGDPMDAGITRRSAVIGLGALAGAVALKGCGGGAEDPTPPSGGNGGAGLTGSFWYQQPNGNLYVSAGGTADPVVVNKVVGDPDTSNFKFGVSRVGPRYLQVGNNGATSTDIASVINVYDHSNHQPYCFINLTGRVSPAAVSPSGNYVAALRSPTFVDGVFNPGSTGNIIDLIIVDISDVNNIRDIRNTRTQGQAAIYGFQWLDGDRFAYMTWGDGNFGDSMYSGSVSAGSQGDVLLGAVDKRGLRIRGFNVHPSDDTKMLLDMFDDDGVSLGTWDVYLYTTSGEFVERVTATGQGYSGVWSPDANHIFFKHGSSIGCAGVGCTLTCSPHYAAADMRDVTLTTAQAIDNDKVPCLSATAWRAS